jgi:hypothetical protein
MRYFIYYKIGSQSWGNSPKEGLRVGDKITNYVILHLQSIKLKSLYIFR